MRYGRVSRSTIYSVEPIQRVGVRYDHGEKEVQNGNSVHNEQGISKRKPRRPSEARPPASDRKDFTNRTALIVRYCFDPATTSDVVHGSEV